MYKEKKPNIQTKKHTLFFPKIWHDEKTYTRNCSFVPCSCLKEAEVKGFFVCVCSVSVASKEPQGTGVFTYKMS